MGADLATGDGIHGDHFDGLRMRSGREVDCGIELEFDWAEKAGVVRDAIRCSAA